MQAVALNGTHVELMHMQCHYCDDDAVYAAESDGIKVGLCEQHFQERLEELSESDAFKRIKDQVDVNRRE